MAALQCAVDAVRYSRRPKALLREFEADRAFYKAGLLPSDFNLSLLEKQYLDVLTDRGRDYSCQYLQPSGTLITPAIEGGFRGQVRNDFGRVHVK
jgi:hypothetical protein